jgi:thioredoxin 2
VIPPLARPLDVEDVEMFDEIRTKAKVPVLVDFWAEWCGPCRMAAPEVEKAALESAGKSIVLKVDTEKLGALAGRYGVQGIPNFVVLMNGDVALQKSGMVKAPQLLSYLETAKAAA